MQIPLIYVELEISDRRGVSEEKYEDASINPIALSIPCNFPLKIHSFMSMQNIISLFNCIDSDTNWTKTLIKGLTEADISVNLLKMIELLIMHSMQCLMGFHTLVCRN